MSAIPVWAWWVGYGVGMPIAAYWVGRALDDHDTFLETPFPLFSVLLWPLALAVVTVRFAFSAPFNAGIKKRREIKASAKFTPGIPVVEDDAR